MAITGLDKKEIVQIGLIVEDALQSATNFRRILGFDVPETCSVTDKLEDSESKYYGEPNEGSAKIICFDMGKVQFEFIEPVDPPTTWQDFLDKSGDGIQHIAFPVSRDSNAAASFVEHGYEVIHQGYWGKKSGSYTYLNTDKDLGLIIELLANFNGFSQKESTFPVDKGIGTDVVTQVGIIVNDIEASAQRYKEVLGLSGGAIIETLGYDVTETTYNGEPSEATAKLAFFDAGQMQIELIQPDEKPSTWRNYLETYGEGAHHIAFQVKDTKKVTDYLAQHGIQIEQQGLYSDRSGMYTYVDSREQLGITLELLESF